MAALVPAEFAATPVVVSVMTTKVEHGARFCSAFRKKRAASVRLLASLVLY